MERSSHPTACCNRSNASVGRSLSNRTNAAAICSWARTERLDLSLCQSRSLNAKRSARACASSRSLSPCKRSNLGSRMSLNERGGIGVEFVISQSSSYCSQSVEPSIGIAIAVNGVSLAAGSLFFHYVIVPRFFSTQRRRRSRIRSSHLGTGAVAARAETAPRAGSPRHATA